MKKKENIKVRDVKPASDPKGGKHQHFPKGGGRKEPVGFGNPRGPGTRQLP